MIYAEYVDRDRSTPWEIFRHHGRQDWVSDQDVMVANLGRTMRLAPVPHYMCWWRIRSIAQASVEELRVISHDKIFERYGLGGEGLPPIIV